MSGRDRRSASAALEHLLPRVDVVVQTPGVRRRGLIIADMDSTMITIECIDELADYAGIKEQVAKVTEAAMRGELDRSEEHTSELQSLMRISYAVLCLKKKKKLLTNAKTRIVVTH